MSSLPGTKADVSRRSLRRDLRGVAAIEFGLAIPFLLALVIGIAEVGTASYESMQVKNAVEAGALYASQHPADLAGITAAVANSTGMAGVTASPAPLGFCGCPGAGGIAVGDCASTCPDGGPQSRYVRVNASFTHVAILAFPGFPDPLVLTGHSTVRVQ